MYPLSDKQIDYIVSDINARGIAMESLQQNLLDHVCCIIEQNLEESGDFESFYQTTIKTFYKDELWEIEEETITLLTFKNYYTMKKIMILSGAISMLTLVPGIIFKFMHWSGASFLITVGILTANLIFLPLLFTLKAKEKQDTRDKFTLAAGGLAAMVMSLSFLFKIMHWPYSMVMIYTSTIIMAVLFLPVYFFTGLRNPATKVNTITSSALIVLAYGLLLMLVSTPQGIKIRNMRYTNSYLRSEQLVKNEQEQLKKYRKSDAAVSISLSLGETIIKNCEALKSMILARETGYATLPRDFENKGALISDSSLDFGDDTGMMDKLDVLQKNVKTYNEENMKADDKGLQVVPVKSSLLDMSEDRALGALYNLNQIELFVLQNERALIAEK